MDSTGKIHDPNAPKKPLTAFVFFSQARRQAIREARPEVITFIADKVLVVSLPLDLLRLCTVTSFRNK